MNYGGNDYDRRVEQDYDHYSLNYKKTYDARIHHTNASVELKELGRKTSLERSSQDQRIPCFGYKFSSY